MIKNADSFLFLRAVSFFSALSCLLEQCLHFVFLGATLFVLPVSNKLRKTMWIHLEQLVPSYAFMIGY